MAEPRNEVIIVGAGQAGLALSACLSERGCPHLLLERDRIAESWRTNRWDSLRLIAPNWTLRLPGFAYQGDDPNGFMGKDEVVDFLVDYARFIDAPVRTGVAVRSLEQLSGEPGFAVQTSNGRYTAGQVVIATGALQKPRIPRCAASLPGSLTQLVPNDYRNPDALPGGAVLVVGSGETGVQIAEELTRAGRPVFLSIGRSRWSPRRYRGRDLSAWARLLGYFDVTVDDLPPGARTGRPNPQVTGRDGGRDLNAHTLAAEGVTLLGRLDDIHDGTVTFRGDLAENLAWGDEQAFGFIHAIDELIEREEIDVPREGLPAYLRPIDELADASPAALRLDEAEIGVVIWATGYQPDLTWIGLPFLDAEGYPIQRRGVTKIPGLFILGLDWLHTAKSGLFPGLGEDAEYLANVITASSVGSSSPTGV